MNIIKRTMSEEMAKKYAEWLETRPPCVKEIGKQFSPGDRLLIHNVWMWVIGFGELADGKATLLITKHDPAVDYALAVKDKVRICPCCLESIRLEGLN